jgi:hypothetical protein
MGTPAKRLGSPGHVRPASAYLSTWRSGRVKGVDSGGASEQCGRCGDGGVAGLVSAPLARSAPVSIDIPALSISSSLGPARGLESSGAIDDAPLSGPSWSLPWWYDEGPAPGQDGSAVILGHVDSAIGTGGLGVFLRLGDVRPGESIDVGLADRSTTHWIASSTYLYSDAAFPDALVYSGSGRPTLRLVTCGGSFDWQTHL